MSAFYLGSSARPLYGFYHAPAGAGSGAVVLCPPGLGEHQFAHRALRILAERLAERGSHVLRFDYSGTGDSWGACVDADPEEWIADTGEAVQELRAMSGRTRVDLVGLRIGALIAAEVAGARTDVGRVVLWDPILDGEEWLGELGAAPGERFLGTQPIELGAHLVSPVFAERARRMGLRSIPSRASGVLLLLTQPSRDDEAQRRLAQVEGIEIERLDQPAPWVVDQSIWTGQVPAQALRRIGEWLAR